LVQKILESIELSLPFNKIFLDEHHLLSPYLQLERLLRTFLLFRPLNLHLCFTEGLFFCLSFGLNLYIHIGDTIRRTITDLLIYFLFLSLGESE